MKPVVVNIYVLERCIQMAARLVEKTDCLLVIAQDSYHVVSFEDEIQRREQTLPPHELGHGVGDGG
jgi:hypothetical protein